jgi:hypothetical protein
LERNWPRAVAQPKGRKIGRSGATQAAAATGRCLIGKPQLIGNSIRNRPEQDGVTHMEKSWSGWQRKAVPKSDADSAAPTHESHEAAIERLTTFFNDGCDRE